MKNLLCFIFCVSISIAKGFRISCSRFVRFETNQYRWQSSMQSSMKKNYDLIDRSIFDDESNDNEVEREEEMKAPSSNKMKPKRKISIFSGLNRWENVNRALLAGVFVAGIGAGITVDSAINTNPKDLASRDAIDRNAPNPKLCTTFGSSAMVLDQRIFITFNPFNIYVTQGTIFDRL